MARILNDIIKDYPSIYRVIIYKTPLDLAKIELGLSKPKRKKTKTPLMDIVTVQKSKLRTRRVIRDYVMCNDFDWFITFTFDPKKVNRYDVTTTSLRMMAWLRRQYAKNANFKYILVPEHHKDGAIHFHGLISNPPFHLKQSHVVRNGRRVYNIPLYRYGFTDAEQLDPKDKEKAVNYISKYITKDMVVMPNKRRYWCSRNLHKPASYYNELYGSNLEGRVLPSKLKHETDYNRIYEVEKLAHEIYSPR